MRSATSFAALACALLLGAAACTGGGPAPDTITRRITVWTEGGDPGSVAAARRIAQGFQKDTGIGVRLVRVSNSRMQRLLGSSPSADRPDVLGRLPLATLQAVGASGLVDTDLVGEVVDGLGEETFRPRALALASRGGERLGVPSDVWLQLIIYRKDLFANAGLPVPDSLDKLLTAATSLDAHGRVGVALPTAAGDPSTERTFEFFALANGCDPIDSGGEVSLDSPDCVATFRYYARLAQTSHRRGEQTTNSVRKAYLAGKAAAIPWSSAILDDLAGLDSETRPTCPKCERGSAYLAKNSGVVAAIRGPRGNQPVQYGDIASWTILDDADTDAAKRFVTYMMNDAYTRWLGVAPEGRLPTRVGTKDQPRSFLDAWAGLKIGAKDGTSLSQIYAPTVLDLLRGSSGHLSRWGLSQGKGAYASATLDDLPVSNAVNAVVEGRASPTRAARKATADIDVGLRSLSPSPTPSGSASPGG